MLLDYPAMVSGLPGTAVGLSLYKTPKSAAGTPDVYLPRNDTSYSITVSVQPDTSLIVWIVRPTAPRVGMLLPPSVMAVSSGGTALYMH